MNYTEKTENEKAHHLCHISSTNFALDFNHEKVWTLTLSHTSWTETGLFLKILSLRSSQMNHSVAMIIAHWAFFLAFVPTSESSISLISLILITPFKCKPLHFQFWLRYIWEKRGGMFALDRFLSISQKTEIINYFFHKWLVVGYLVVWWFRLVNHFLHHPQVQMVKTINLTIGFLEMRFFF